jgi:hypothetical protein
MQESLHQSKIPAPGDALRCKLFSRGAERSSRSSSSLFRLGGDIRESRGISHRDIGQDFAVDVDAARL